MPPSDEHHEGDANDKATGVLMITGKDLSLLR
jgi:hypothetical protein